MPFSSHRLPVNILPVPVFLVRREDPQFTVCLETLMNARVRRTYCAVGVVCCTVLFAAGPALPADRTTVRRLPLKQERIHPAQMIETTPGRYFIDFGKGPAAL
jgi:hypothetical protein